MKRSPINPISAKGRARQVAMRALKKQLMDRCGGQCERIIKPIWTTVKVRCPNRAVDAHHILAVSQGGKDELSNLLGLCRADHNFCKDHPAAAMAEGLVKKAGGK